MENTNQILNFQTFHLQLWSILGTFNPLYFRNHEQGQICSENTDWKFHMESKEKRINLSEDHQMIIFLLSLVPISLLVFKKIKMWKAYRWRTSILMSILIAHITFLHFFKSNINICRMSAKIKLIFTSFRNMMKSEFVFLVLRWVQLIFYFLKNERILHLNCNIMSAKNVKFRHKKAKTFSLGHGL